MLEADVGEGNFGSVSVAVLAPGLVAGGKRRERAFKKVAVKTVKGKNYGINFRLLRCYELVAL